MFKATIDLVDSRAFVSEKALAGLVAGGNSSQLRRQFDLSEPHFQGEPGLKVALRSQSMAWVHQAWTC